MITTRSRSARDLGLEGMYIRIETIIDRSLEKRYDYIRIEISKVRLHRIRREGILGLSP
jgi:hypothetical protein